MIRGSPTPIGQIQGTGANAALTGTRMVRGIVVADYAYPGSGATGDYLRGTPNAAWCSRAGPLDALRTLLICCRGCFAQTASAMPGVCNAFVHPGWGERCA